MDEATASVDSQTDTVIQRIIREDFANCTILSISYRISTVMDWDRVMVIDAGIHLKLLFMSCYTKHFCSVIKHLSLLLLA